MSRIFENLPRAAVALAIFLIAGVAQADIVAQGSVNFTEPNFGIYSGVKAFTVYTHDDAGNPAPGNPGEFTYVYTIANDNGSLTSIISYEIAAPIGSVISASFVDDAGNPTPAGVIDLGNGLVEWFWQGTDLIDPGEISDRLTIISTWSPGGTTDNMFGVGDEANLDTPGDCTGPFVAPPDTGEPLPCTIGFWKNRSVGKQGTLQWFPDPEFDQVVTAAVALSGGLFVDEADLLANLQSKGKRSILERGKQQLAATLLNLAAGDLFPDNVKCKLFDGNSIVDNACGMGITIGDAVAQALVDIAGDTAAQHDAQECSDDLNNGISLAQ